MRRFWNQRIFVGGQRLSTLLFACCFLLFNGLSETLSPEPYKRDDILQQRPMLFNGLSTIYTNNIPGGGTNMPYRHTELSRGALDGPQVSGLWGPSDISKHGNLCISICLAYYLHK